MYIFTYFRVWFCHKENYLWKFQRVQVTFQCAVILDLGAPLSEGWFNCWSWVNKPIRLSCSSLAFYWRLIGWQQHSASCVVLIVCLPNVPNCIFWLHLRNWPLALGSQRGYSRDWLESQNRKSRICFPSPYVHPKEKWCSFCFFYIIFLQ